MGRKRKSSHPFGSQEAVAHLLEVVSSFVTDLTECPSDGKTRKIQKIIKIINQPVPSSEEQYVSANNIFDDSAMESEEDEIADEDDYNLRHKHKRNELSGLPMPHENRTPAEEPSTEQPTKNRVKPFDHSSKFDKRRFRSNNPLHSRGAVGPSMMKTCIPRQRCPDFEDLGYCLRGDMCLMEHGANCIMVEDVQSLLQLKLMGFQPGTVPKPITLKDPLRLNGVLTSSITAPDGDEYNPDQPLWANGQSVASPNYTSAGTATAPDAYDPNPPLWANGQWVASPNYTSAGTATAPDAYDPNPPLWASGQSVVSPNYTSAGTATAPDAYDPNQSLWANGQSVASPNYTSAGTATAPDAYDPNPPLWANGQSVASPNYTSAGTATAPDAYDPNPPLWANGQSVVSPNYTSAGTATAPDAYDPNQPLWANGQSVASPNYTSAGTATAPDAYDPNQPLWANGQSVASPNYTGAGTATAPDADSYDPDQPLWANGQLMASPNHTSAGTATGASTNNPTYLPDSGPSVWSPIGN